MKQYEQEVLKKIDSGEKFYNDELRDISTVFEVDKFYDDVVKGEKRFKVINTVVELCGRFFVIKYGYKFPEFKESYWEQPVEVEKVKVEKVVILDEWKVKE